MRTSILATTLAVGLATAAPSDPIPFRAYEVQDFSFGCTVDCAWSFNVTAPGQFNKIPCRGNLKQQSYLACNAAELGPGKSVRAYIQDTVSDGGKTATDVVKIEYSEETGNESQKTVISYWGEKQVYSQTGPNAKLQKTAFEVPVVRYG